jgi:hypothetical protein
MLIGCFLQSLLPAKTPGCNNGGLQGYHKSGIPWYCALACSIPSSYRVLTELRGNRSGRVDFRAFRGRIRHSHRRVQGIFPFAPVEFRSFYPHIFFSQEQSCNQGILLTHRIDMVNQKAVSVRAIQAAAAEGLNARAQAPAQNSSFTLRASYRQQQLQKRQNTYPSTHSRIFPYTRRFLKTW